MKINFTMLLAGLIVIFLLPLFIYYLCNYIFFNKTVSKQLRRTILVRDLITTFIFLVIIFAILMSLIIPIISKLIGPFIENVLFPAQWVINKTMGPAITEGGSFGQFFMAIIITFNYLLSCLLSIINANILMGFKKQYNLSTGKIIMSNIVALIGVFIATPFIIFVMLSIVYKL